MIALMYHDIVPPGEEDASGFRGPDAARYKLSPDRFDDHLRALAALPSAREPALTFDDGGASAMRAAEMLARWQRRGCFFVTVDRIGTRGFLDVASIRDLHRAGHVVGSHSCSHPLRMARCSAAQLHEEWHRSRSTLSDMVSGDVKAASVPGGEFAGRVADAAAEAGFTVLYTSEPTARVRLEGGLSIRGRYTIQRLTSAATAAALAACAPLPCAAQAMIWTAKKLSKRLAGDQYLRLRRLLLGHARDVRWGDAGAGD